MVDLFGVFVLLLGSLFSGQPDQVSWHFSIGANVSYSSLSEPAVTLTVGADPTFIYHKPAPSLYGWNPSWTCGMSDGYNVWIAPHGSCGDVLPHEMKHVQQRRALGWVGVQLFRFTGLDEPPGDNWKPDGMWTPKGNGFSLFRLEIPLFWRNYQVAP